MNYSLEIKNISLNIGGLQILSDINLSIKAQGIVALIGPNGAGKTSLLDCISGLYKPTSGQVILNNRDITKKPPSKRARLGLGRIFQISELYNEMSVLDNLLLGCHIHMHSSLFATALRTRSAISEELVYYHEAESILEMLNLRERKDQLVEQLPHGIRRKVEIGRALLMKPGVLLLDEPVSGMNPSEVEELIDIIRNCQKDRSLLIILVEHHMGVVLRIAQRVIVINFGKIIADGPPDEIKTSPIVIDAYLGKKVS